MGKRKSTATDYVHPADRGPKVKKVKGAKKGKNDKKAAQGGKSAQQQQSAALPAAVPVFAVPTAAAASAAAYYALAAQLAGPHGAATGVGPAQLINLIPAVAAQQGLAEALQGGLGVVCSPDGSSEGCSDASAGIIPTLSEAMTPDLGEDEAAELDAFACSQRGAFEASAEPDSFGVAAPCSLDGTLEFDCLELLGTVDGAQRGPTLPMPPLPPQQHHSPRAPSTEAARKRDIKRLEEVVAEDIASAVDAEIASWSTSSNEDGSDVGHSSNGTAPLPEEGALSDDAWAPATTDGSGDDEDDHGFMGLDCLHLLQSMNGDEVSEPQERADFGYDSLPLPLSDEGSSMSILDPTSWFELPQLGSPAHLPDGAAGFGKASAVGHVGKRLPKKGGVAAKKAGIVRAPKVKRAGGRPKLTWHLSHLM